MKKWIDRYKKPVVVDECGYEGDVEYCWGNITAEEMVCRFWQGFARGGYVGHGETYRNEDEILWWSKGGRLHGESPERISFLKKIIDEAPVNNLDYIIIGFDWDVSSCAAGKEGEYYLVYFDKYQPAYKKIQLPEDEQYTIDLIDTWNMTIKRLDGLYSGETGLDLPAKPYMALRIQKV